MREILTTLACVLTVLVNASCAHARDELPDGYSRGGITKRVMLTDVDTTKDKRIFEWWVVQDVSKHAAADYLQNQAISAKYAEQSKMNKDPALGQKLGQKTWCPVWRVALAVNTADDEAKGVMSPAAIDDLTKRLREFFSGYPRPGPIKTPEDNLAYSVSWGCEKSGYHTESLGKRSDLVEIMKTPLVDVDPIIRSWQSDHGAPYREPKNAILHVWVFRDYVAKDELPQWLAKQTKDMAGSNANASGPHYELLNLTDVRPPE